MVRGCVIPSSDLVEAEDRWFGEGAGRRTTGRQPVQRGKVFWYFPNGGFSSPQRASSQPSLTRNLSVSSKVFFLNSLLLKKP